MISREDGRSAFGGAACDYDAARPPYPTAIYDDALRGRTPASSALVDIGAGNGLAAQGFIDRGVTEVTFVEPDLRFRPFLEARSTHTRIENSTFEGLELAPGEFDFAIVGTAWHWLEPRDRMTRLAALLRPGGRIVLVWNLFRDDDKRDDFHDATQWIFEQLPGQQTAANRPLGALERGDRMTEFVSTGRFVTVSLDIYRWSIQLTSEAVRSLYSAFSPIQKLTRERRDWALDQLVDVAERKFGGVVERPMTTPCYIGTLRS